MSDSTVSALNAAVVPLSGAELVPIVQNGLNCRVPSSAIGGAGTGVYLPSVSAVLASGNNANFSPAGYIAAVTKRLILTAGVASILGSLNAAGIGDGFSILLVNGGATGFQIAHEDAASAVGNQFVNIV